MTAEQWRERGARLRAMAAEIAEISLHFNLERETCTCGESSRWKHMSQWQLNERAQGIVEKINNLAEILQRRAGELATNTTEKEQHNG